MLITTQDNFADHEITETLGMVKGNTIRARNLFWRYKDKSGNPVKLTNVRK